MIVVITDIEPFPTEVASYKNGFHGYDSDDGGIYLTHRVADNIAPLYVDIKSSSVGCEGDNHAAFKALGGKRIRVTIETLD